MGDLRVGGQDRSKLLSKEFALMVIQLIHRCQLQLGESLALAEEGLHDRVIKGLTHLLVSTTKCKFLQALLRDVLFLQDQETNQFIHGRSRSINQILYFHRGNGFIFFDFMPDSMLHLDWQPLFATHGDDLLVDRDLGTDDLGLRVI